MVLKIPYWSWIMRWVVCVYLTRIVFLTRISLISFIFSLLFLVINVSFIIEWEFISLISCDIQFVLIFDWISTIFLRFVTLISALVLYYRGSYILLDKNINRFLYLVVAFVVSIGALICSPNLIRILLGWDGLGLISYVLVIYYQNEKSRNAGILTVLSNRVGDVAILLRIALMFTFGGWNFYVYTLFISDNLWLFKSLIILSAITKRAQIPFSAWLPAAIAAPTPVSALVHSSTLVTAGVYLLIRFRIAFRDSKVNHVLLIVSSLTIFIAGLGANFEYDLKKIIALSTLSQLGVIIRILALGFPILAFFHLLTHALFKALLFICAGVLIHNEKDYQDIRAIGSLRSSLPLTCMCINLANLALCGTPFLAGFYSKDLILEVATISNINSIIFWLYIISTGLTVCYTFRLIFIRLTRAFKSGMYFLMGDEDFVITNPIIGLRLGAILGGALLSWLIFPEVHMICLPFFFKTLAIMVRLLGALLGYLCNINKVNYSLKSLYIYYSTVVSGSIWFIPYLSTFMVSYINLRSAKLIQDSIDKGWSEYYGAQGLFLVIGKSTQYLQVLQDNIVKLYIKSFLFLMLILLLFLIYLCNLKRISHWSCERDFKNP